ncbi:MAG: class I SAM-dependent methyltransferase [Candidatus Omnitrophica bacterium]|nr:class I SAM-dependent methyltransferase [Candidatus Omnitrophota bacterium]
MKSVVIFDRYNGVDLKPAEMFNDYVKLTAESIQSFFLTNSELNKCTCPGCGSQQVSTTFEKFGLKYNECENCGTLYISPRPADNDIVRYYRESPARILWRERLTRSTDKTRKNKIVNPRFAWIEDSTLEYLDNQKHYVDINTDQEVYIEAIEKSQVFDRKTLINPFLQINSEKKDLSIVDKGLDSIELEGDVDVVSLFEVCDHTSDINLLFQKVSQMLQPGGICFITSILASGFDFQVLWDKSENLFAPDRLNVFSVKGFRNLFTRHNFECLEFSTPGILDVENVKATAGRNPDVTLPKFVQNMIVDGDDSVRQAFQEFLQTNLLSSYARIVIRKNG